MIIAQVPGRLGRDAELKHAGDSPVLSFTVATDRREKGEKVTDWVSCSLWGTRAEKLAPHLVKGTQVFVSGQLSTRESTKNGKTYLELRVDQIELLGGGNRGERQEYRSREDNQHKPDQEALDYVVSSDDIPF